MLNISLLVMTRPNQIKSDIFYSWWIPCSHFRTNLSTQLHELFFSNKIQIYDNKKDTPILHKCSET